MANDIVRFGVTELEQYPVCKYRNCCKQIIENDILFVPCKKPDIESIENIHVKVDIENFKIIKTILGYKIVVESVKKYKLMYTANNDAQSVHSAHFEERFCECVLLESFCWHNSISDIKDIFIGVEDIVVKDYDSRKVDVSLLLIMYPVVI